MRAIPKLILASASPRRKELLTQCGYSFTIFAPEINEDRKGLESPLEHVRRLSAEKAGTAQKTNPGFTIIAADTIVVLGDTILGKPADEKHSNAILGQLSGKTHLVHTAFTLATDEDSLTEVVSTEVTFKLLTEHDISTYTASHEGMDKAGAYGIQTSAIRFIEKIVGSPSNVIGLPIVEVQNALSRLYDQR